MKKPHRKQPHRSRHFKQLAEEHFKQEREINIALAGNPNVGKSVIFNQLTGLSQTIGNWPGKTVERKIGELDFMGFHFNIVDLPGIYSLSAYSLEEIVSREYLVSERVDIIVNVVDATNLERNLFLTFQLLELKIPMIICLNQMDILRKRNIEIDFEKMEKIFKVPVIPTVAVHGKGVHQLLEESIEFITCQDFHPHHKEHQRGRWRDHPQYLLSSEEFLEKLRSCSSLKEIYHFPDLSDLLSFGKEIESKIQLVKEKIVDCKKYFSQFNYPPRFLAIKILEEDTEIERLFKDKEETCEILEEASNCRDQLEELHGEDITTIISSEIYHNINNVIDKILIIKSEKDVKKQTLTDKLDHLTTHSFWGYIILLLVLFGIYYFTFTVGDLIGGYLDEIYGIWTEGIYALYGENTILVMMLWDGGVGGFFGAVGGVLVYVVPFFLIIEILQDSGYLPRAAFLMDKFMHALGIHGKSIIPMILGFGCNVPACAGCRIMETQREKKISIALTSLIPCAAVMTVVLGLVGRYLGLGWVLALFLINFLVIILIGKILNKTMPGKCTELIMEMHEYRLPNVNVILKQTWIRSKEFIFKSLPLIIGIGIFLEVMLIFNIFDPINIVLYPITVLWLGLPMITGIFLIYGILRKELTLILLQVLAGSLGLSILQLLTPLQMITFSLVTMLYIPCFATIIIIARETSWKYAIKISLLEITIALLIGGIINWIALGIFAVI
ncbi:MAG: ferrous iron transport protein B [Candidatus Lokiarchaeota archaeon]|nr:ferrous iron transport protein B [Candidatus Lokiarchaeota archaeon]